MGLACGLSLCLGILVAEGALGIPSRVFQCRGFSDTRQELGATNSFILRYVLVFHDEIATLEVVRVFIIDRLIDHWCGFHRRHNFVHFCMFVLGNNVMPLCRSEPVFNIRISLHN